MASCGGFRALNLLLASKKTHDLREKTTCFFLYGWVHQFIPSLTFLFLYLYGDLGFKGLIIWMNNSCLKQQYLRDST